MSKSLTLTQLADMAVRVRYVVERESATVQRRFKDDPYSLPERTYERVRRDTYTTLAGALRAARKLAAEPPYIRVEVWLDTSGGTKYRDRSTMLAMVGMDALDRVWVDLTQRGANLI